MRNEDVASTELEITSVKETKKLQPQQEQQATTKLRLQEETEALQGQQGQRVAEELRLQQEAERNQFGYQLKTFEFETAELSLKSQLLGLVRKPEIKYIPKSGKYFTEDLGNGIFLEMVHIPGGTFIMGSPENEEGYNKSQSPQHEVTVPAFFMGKYLVTQKQWRIVAALPKININLEPEPSHFQGDNLPVEGVSWYDTEEFCARLSQKTNKAYRLPSEAEWEYACRGRTTTAFYFGKTISPELANYDSQYREKTTEVGIFPANPFGLYDMCGNVWEWCEDGWHEDYINAPDDGTAWLNDSNNRRVMRGGSWLIPSENCRSSFRFYADAGFFGCNLFGFRVMCGE